MLFAIALIDASIIGAAAVGLATSYAIGDVLGLRHSLHRKPASAKGFYAIFAGLMVLAAVIVIIPGSPLGLLTEGVQVLAGVLLPSAGVFLLLLCNDRQVLGPWVNGWKLNLFTSAVIAVLVMLSVILTASVLFPDLPAAVILGILGGGSALAILIGTGVGVRSLLRRRTTTADSGNATEAGDSPVDMPKVDWRMPPLATLARPQLSLGRRLGLGVLRSYLAIAAALVIFRIVQLALGG